MCSRHRASRGALLIQIRHPRRPPADTSVLPKNHKRTHGVSHLRTRHPRAQAFEGADRDQSPSRSRSSTLLRAFPLQTRHYWAFSARQSQFFTSLISPTLNSSFMLSNMHTKLSTVCSSVGCPFPMLRSTSSMRYLSSITGFQIFLLLWGLDSTSCVLPSL